MSKRNEVTFGRLTYYKDIKTVKGTRAPLFTTCVRYGHGQNLHKRDCRECRNKPVVDQCPKWVGGRCRRCYEYVNRANSLCANCYQHKGVNYG